MKSGLGSRSASALLALALGLGLALAMAAWAIDPERLEDPTLQARYTHIIQQLRCLKCQNETIGDSDAPIAADLRLKTREMLKAGRSDQEIYRYMTDRYGDFVLYNPPVKAKTLLLWAAPALFVLIGIGVAASVIMRRARNVGSDEEADLT